MGWSSSTGWNAEGGWSRPAPASPGGGPTLVARTYHEFAGGGPDTFSFNHTGAVAGDIMVAYLLDVSGGIYLNFDPSGTPHQVVPTAYYGSDPNGYSNVGYTDALTSADLTSGQVTTSNVDPTGGGFCIVLEIWHNVTAFVFKSATYSAASDTTLVMPGFVKDGAHKAAHAIVIESGNAVTTTITGSPGTWVQDYGPLTGPIGYFPAFGVTNSTNYTNASVTLSGFSTEAAQRVLLGEFT